MVGVRRNPKREQKREWGMGPGELRMLIEQEECDMNVQYPRYKMWLLANLFHRPITYYLRQAHLLVAILDSTKAEHGTVKFLEAYYSTNGVFEYNIGSTTASVNINLLLLIHLNSSTSELSNTELNFFMTSLVEDILTRILGYVSHNMSYPS
eukprot:scaffold2335_cov135-Skeletonema_menzelii.AAC.8